MTTRRNKTIKAIVIGTSAGGLDALSKLLCGLPVNFPIPVLVVIHLPPNKISAIADILNEKCSLHVVEAGDKTTITQGYIYFAPPNYHMLVEKDSSLSLSTEAPVQYSRPSIDVLFETAADAYGKNLLGIVLTGANSDGANGLKKVIDSGGEGIIQNPEEAEIPSMPRAAILKCPTAAIKNLQDIHLYIQTLY